MERTAEDKELSKPLSGNARKGFVKKVYGILTTQLAFTAIWCLLTIRYSRLSDLVKSQRLGILMAIITISCTLGLGLSKRIARKVPLNYFLLFLLTFGTGWSVSHLLTQYPPNIVAEAFGVTSASVAGLTFYAMRTTRESVSYRALMYSALLSFLLEIFTISYYRTPWTNATLNFALGISTAASILYQTDAVLGKKNANYSTDDYIQAAMNIYIEIVDLFIKVLKILNEINGKEEKKKDSKSK